MKDKGERTHNHGSLVLNFGAGEGDQVIATESAASDNVGGKLEGFGHVEAARLGNAPNASLLGEVAVDRLPSDRAHRVEGGALKATSDVKEVHVIANILALAEDPLGRGHSRLIEHGVGAPAADMEADANDVQVERLGLLEKGGDLGESSAKLGAQATETAFVVSEDAQDKLGVRMVFGDFAELIGVVKRHHLDTNGCSVAHKGSCLAWVGVNDAVWRDAERQNEFNLCLRGAIKAESQVAQKRDHSRIGVRFDSCRNRQTVGDQHLSICSKRGEDRQNATHHRKPRRE